MPSTLLFAVGEKTCFAVGKLKGQERKINFVLGCGRAREGEREREREHQHARLKQREGGEREREGEQTRKRRQSKKVERERDREKETDRDNGEREREGRTNRGKQVLISVVSAAGSALIAGAASRVRGAEGTAQTHILRMAALSSPSPSLAPSVLLMTYGLEQRFTQNVSAEDPVELSAINGRPVQSKPCAGKVEENASPSSELPSRFLEDKVGVTVLTSFDDAWHV